MTSQRLQIKKIVLNLGIALSLEDLLAAFRIGYGTTRPSAIGSQSVCYKGREVVLLYKPTKIIVTEMGPVK